MLLTTTHKTEKHANEIDNTLKSWFAKKRTAFPLVLQAKSCKRQRHGHTHTNTNTHQGFWEGLQSSFIDTIIEGATCRTEETHPLQVLGPFRLRIPPRCQHVKAWVALVTAAIRHLPLWLSALALRSHILGQHWV